MAKKTKKSTATDSASANTNSRSKAKTSFNYAEYFNPTQFMNNFTNAQQNYNPANWQKYAEQWMQTNQKNIETMTACTQMAMETAKELMEEQAAFANRWIQETTSTFQEAFANSDSDPKDKMEEIADYTKYCMEKAATQARKAAEESMQTAQKISTALTKRVSESIEEMQSAA